MRIALIVWVIIFVGASWVEQSYDDNQAQQIQVVINDTCTEADYIDDYVSCDYEDMKQHLARRIR